MGEDNVGVFRFAAPLGSANEGCGVADVIHVVLEESGLPIVSADDLADAAEKVVKVTQEAD